MAKITSKTRVKTSGSPKRVSHGHHGTSTERALAKKGKYKDYRLGIVRTKTAYTGPSRSRKDMRSLGFSWSETGFSTGIKDATAQQIRNGLLKARHIILQEALERVTWENATGNAITAFMIGVYDWNQNVVVYRLSQEAGLDGLPKYKLARGMFPGSHDNAKKGMHHGHRFGEGQTSWYHIHDSGLQPQESNTPDYLTALDLLNDAASLQNVVRNTGGKDHYYQQALKIVHPVDYIRKSPLKYAQRSTVRIVTECIKREINSLQKQIDGGMLRDMLGRFAKGSKTNAPRDARGRFMKRT